MIFGLVDKGNGVWWVDEVLSWFIGRFVGGLGGLVGLVGTLGKNVCACVHISTFSRNLSVKRKVRFLRVYKNFLWYTS